MGSSSRIEIMMEQALGGDAEAAFELGMAYSSGGGGLTVDLIEAHRWLNVATQRGHGSAALWRSDIAAEMSAREVVEAQRRARATLAPAMRLAA